MQPAEVAEYWEANAETWTRQARAGYDVYRDLLNTPAFLAMLPPVDGLSGLDVGCGEGANTRQLARPGARMHAVDITPTFVRHARAMEADDPFGVVFQTGDGMIICPAGVVIAQFGEPCAAVKLAQAEPVVADSRVAPLSLHIRATKPNAPVRGPAT